MMDNFSVPYKPSKFARKQVSFNQKKPSLMRVDEGQPRIKISPIANQNTEDYQPEQSPTFACTLTPSPNQQKTRVFFNGEIAKAQMPAKRLLKNNQGYTGSGNVILLTKGKDEQGFITTLNNTEEVKQPVSSPQLQLKSSPLIAKQSESSSVQKKYLIWEKLTSQYFLLSFLLFLIILDLSRVNGFDESLFLLTQPDQKSTSQNIITNNVLCFLKLSIVCLLLFFQKQLNNTEGGTETNNNRGGLQAPLGSEISQQGCCLHPLGNDVQIKNNEASTDHLSIPNLKSSGISNSMHHRSSSTPGSSSVNHQEQKVHRTTANGQDKSLTMTMRVQEQHVTMRKESAISQINNPQYGMLLQIPNNRKHTSTQQVAIGGHYRRRGNQYRKPFENSGHFLNLRQVNIYNEKKQGSLNSRIQSDEKVGLNNAGFNNLQVPKRISSPHTFWRGVQIKQSGNQLQLADNTGEQVPQLSSSERSFLSECCSVSRDESKIGDSQCQMPIFHTNNNRYPKDSSSKSIFYQSQMRTNSNNLHSSQLQNALIGSIVSTPGGMHPRVTRAIIARNGCPGGTGSGWNNVMTSGTLNFGQRAAQQFRGTSVGTQHQIILQNMKTNNSSSQLANSIDFYRKKIAKLEKQLNNTKIFLNMVIHDMRNPTNSIEYAIKQVIKLITTNIVNTSEMSNLQMHQQSHIRQHYYPNQSNQSQAAPNYQQPLMQIAQQVQATQNIVVKPNQKLVIGQNIHQNPKSNGLDSMSQLSSGKTNKQLGLPQQQLQIQGYVSNGHSQNRINNLMIIQQQQQFQQKQLIPRQSQQQIVSFQQQQLPQVSERPLSDEDQDDLMEDIDSESSVNSLRNNSEDEDQHITHPKGHSPKHSYTKIGGASPLNQEEKKEFILEEVKQPAEEERKYLIIEEDPDEDLLDSSSMPNESESFNEFPVERTLLTERKNMILTTEPKQTKHPKNRRQNVRERVFMIQTQQNGAEEVSNNDPVHQLIIPYQTNFESSENSLVSYQFSHNQVLISDNQPAPLIGLPREASNGSRNHSSVNYQQPSSQVQPAASRAANNASIVEQEEEEKKEPSLQPENRDRVILSPFEAKNRGIQNNNVDNSYLLKVAPRKQKRKCSAGSSNPSGNARNIEPSVRNEMSMKSQQQPMQVATLNQNFDNHSSVRPKKPSNNLVFPLKPPTMQQQSNNSIISNQILQKSKPIGGVQASAGNSSNRRLLSSLMLTPSPHNFRFMQPQQTSGNINQQIAMVQYFQPVIILNLEDKKQCEQLLKNSLFSSTMLLNLINDLLDLAKIENQQFNFNNTMFNLHEIVQKALDTLDFQAMQKSIKMEYLFDEDAAGYFMEIGGDDNRYLQILLNFLSNALKFTPNNGSVKVEIRLLDQQNIVIKEKKSGLNDRQSLNTKTTTKNQGAQVDQATFSNTVQHSDQLKRTKSMKNLVPIQKSDISPQVNNIPDGQDLKAVVENALKNSNVPIEKYIKFELRIQDSGYGISKENLSKLFMNFGKLEEHAAGNKTGTGLGLSICKSLIELMGGNVNVESELGKGTTFIMQLQSKCIMPSSVDIMKWVRKFKYKDQPEEQMINFNEEGLHHSSIPLNNNVLTNEVQGEKHYGIVADQQNQKRINHHRMMPFFKNSCNLEASQNKLLLAPPDPQHHQVLLFQQQNDNQGNLLQVPVGGRRGHQHPRKAPSIYIEESEDMNSQQNYIEPLQPGLFIQSQNDPQQYYQDQNMLHDQSFFKQLMPNQALQQLSNYPMGNYCQSSQMNFVDNLPSQFINFSCNNSSHGTVQQNTRVYSALVANDDTFQLSIITMLMTKAGFQVDQAENGLVAVQMQAEMQQESKKQQKGNKVGGRGYDVILLDLDMPIMNGMEACQKIRANENGRKEGHHFQKLFQIDTTKKSSQKPKELGGGGQASNSDEEEVVLNSRSLIIALSGLITDNVIDKGLKCGFDDFIEAPLTDQKIADQIVSKLESIEQIMIMMSQNQYQDDYLQEEEEEKEEQNYQHKSYFQHGYANLRMINHNQPFSAVDEEESNRHDGEDASSFQDDDLNVRHFLNEQRRVLANQRQQ